MEEVAKSHFSKSEIFSHPWPFNTGLPYEHKISSDKSCQVPILISGTLRINGFLAEVVAKSAISQSEERITVCSVLAAY